ncbi:DUF397 domain-containing protein [Nocardia speluncae]|uniref:DUF397 domain-containing protein n=1 Tax=Nocardia speluncae TaxID=419477 RepID=A0A846XMM4_9NOCA|nr:DUF397 domain-containing protein [Nocardia speluncae]
MKEDRSLEVGGTLPRRQLGRYLKEAREGSGMTLDRAAALMEWNKSTLSRLERGLTERVRVRDVLALCESYGLDDDQAAVAKGLAEQTPAKSWWHAYGDLIPSCGCAQVSTRIRHPASSGARTSAEPRPDKRNCKECQLVNVDLSSAQWFKSRHSGGGADCVEIAHLDGGVVAVRDSKNPTGPALVFTPAERDTFLGAARP